MSEHKRRRSQAFRGGDAPTQNTSAENTGSGKLDNLEQQDDEKEQGNDLWETFREEHHEAIEQLPLSLHRQFTLMRELDEQASGHNDERLLVLRKYITLRQASASRSPSLNEPDSAIETEYKPVCFDDATRQSSVHESSMSTPPNGASSGSAGLQQGSLRQVQHLTAAQSLVSTSTSSDGTYPETSREMLSHIAWLSEEILRASEEKVNIAQASYDSVERHIRLLDQAIKEQETAITLGIRSGTHPAPIVLPDLVVPRWARPSRVTLSPSPSLSSAEEESEVPGMGISDTRPVIGMVSSDASPGMRPQRKKGKKGSGKGQNQTEVVQDVPEVPRRGTRTLRLTVTQPAVEIPPDDLPERRYCYCNRVSFGDMVGCDNSRCKIDWFHLGCTGLTKVPEKYQKWYCKHCSARRRR